MDLDSVDSFGFGVTHIDSRRIHTCVTSLATLHETSGRRYRRVLFWALYLSLFLSRCLRAVDPLPRKRLAGFEKTIHRGSSPSPPSSCVLFYGARCKLPKSSTGSPACCAPPGDELLLSRASRSLTLCGVSLEGPASKSPNSEK